MTPVALFFLKLCGALAPLMALGYFLRVYPRKPLVLLALAPAILSVGLLVRPELTRPIWLVNGAVVLLAFGDALTLPRRKSFAVERKVGRIASLRKDHPVVLTIGNQSRRRFLALVRDDVPHELQAEPTEFRIRMSPRSRATVSYHTRSVRRGAFELVAVHICVRSRFGLWQRILSYPLVSTINVYPDMKQLSEYALLARTNRLSLLGVRRTRKVGQDHEFERLRDYTLDDNFKHIDWRSTARRNKLTVKDFQASQSQRLIFLVDCGRMMANQAAGLSLLDHALNSMLMLSYVALAHGDSVGLVCFSDEIHAYVPPKSSLDHMNRLLHASFNLFPRLVESRYDEAFLYLASRLRKRSLVVLITNLIDEVNSNQVERYLGNLAGRHLPLGVWMRDRRVFEAADVENPRGAALYRGAAAAEILSWRHQVLVDLQTKGVLAVDVFPEDLTAPLVNSYLDIKARHLL